MPGTIFDTYGAPALGLADCKIATYNGDGTYGSLVDVPSVQLLTTTIKVQSSQLEGDDQITATAARVVGGQVKFRFGGISLAAGVVMFGTSIVSSGSGGTSQSAQTLVGGAKLPYFGICGKALGEDSGGDLHIWLPKVRIMSDFDFGNLEYGKFAVTEITAYAISDSYFDLINYIEHKTAASITFPPSGITSH